MTQPIKSIDDFLARRTVSGLWVLTGAFKIYNFNPKNAWIPVYFKLSSHGHL